MGLIGKISEVISNDTNQERELIDDQRSPEGTTPHEEWLETDPRDRGDHPIEEIKEAQRMSMGDECVLSGCDAKWEKTPISATANQGESVTGEISAQVGIGSKVAGTTSEGRSTMVPKEVLSCSDPACPTSMKNPVKASEYLRGKFEAARFEAVDKRDQIQSLRTGKERTATRDEAGRGDQSTASILVDDPNTADRGKENTNERVR